MKLIVISLVALNLMACSAPLPTAPETVQSAPDSSLGPVCVSPCLATIWAMAVARNGSGSCIADATLEIVSGPRAGQRFTQEPCDVWDTGGGFMLKDLTGGVELTFRVSASGYAATEVTVVPVASSVHRAMLIELSRG